MIYKPEGIPWQIRLVDFVPHFARESLNTTESLSVIGRRAAGDHVNLKIRVIITVIGVFRFDEAEAFDAAERGEWTF